MGLIPDADLAAMRTLVTDSLDLPCSIQRAVSTPDAWGSEQQTFTTVATTLCNLAKPTAQISQQYAARLANQQAWVARFTNGMDIREGDVVVVSGQSLTVQAILTPNSYSVSTRALVAADR
jgi:hypothetical protein